MPIDLGEARKDTYDIEDPVDPVGLGNGETVYPKFCYRGPKDLDLPEHGKMVIEYRKTTERYRADPESGDHIYYECEITVKQILSAEAEKDIRPSQRDTSAEDALDALAREHSDDDDESY